MPRQITKPGRDKAIRDLSRAHMSYADIGRWFGITRQRVEQIVRGRSVDLGLTPVPRRGLSLRDRRRASALYQVSRGGRSIGYIVASPELHPMRRGHGCTVFRVRIW